MDKGKARQLDSDHSKAVPPRDRLEDSPLSYNQLVSGIIDFLEVAFHTILCMRSVYPYDVFARRKKYSHPCYQSRHPGLNEYISRVLAALRIEIEKSTVRKVILVIRPNIVIDPTGRIQGCGSSVEPTSSDGSNASPGDAYERFVFNLDYIQPFSLMDERDRDLAISHNVTSNELEMMFRGFMQKLMVVDGILYDMPTAVAFKGHDGDVASTAELTFAVVLEMVDDDMPPLGKDQNEASTGDWIPADAENLGRSSGACRNRPSNGHDADGLAPKIRPIKTLDSGVINLMLYVEEDIYAKSGQRQSSHSSPPNQKNIRPTSAQPTRIACGVEDELLLSKATQIDVSSGAGGSARDVKNRARRLEAERDLDEPGLAQAQAELDYAHAKAKRKRARMVLGETRAAESDSESSSSAPNSPSGTSQSVRDEYGGQLSGSF